MLYDADKTRRVPLLLRHASDGGFQPLVDAVAARVADDRTFAWGLFMSLTCTHDVPFIAAPGAQIDTGCLAGIHRRPWATGSGPSPE